MDPTIYRGAGAFFGDVEDLVTTLRQTPAADPMHPVLMPGDIENATERERRTEGVPLAPELIKQLRELASAVGVQFYLD
nr:Ldh family oxidoreductase [Halomonas socia]